MMKLNFVSISAASDYTDADKHINLGKATTAGKKIEAAAKKFAAAQAKGDAVASKVMVKLAAKTQRQIEKALAPIAYYYVSKKTKPVPFSAAKQKAQDVTYMRKRAVRVMTRKRPSDAYTLVFAAYNPAILGKEAAAIQRDLIKAVEMHGGASVKTKETATKVSTQRQDEATKQFNANVAVLSEIIGTKIKPEQMFNYVPMRGVPATYFTLPNKGVLVVRHADAAQLRAIKKKAAEDAAKASTSSVSESAAAGESAGWNAAVKALGFPSLALRKSTVQTPRGEKAHYTVSNINPSVSAKYVRMGVEFKGNKFRLAARPRSLDPGKEMWDVFPKPESQKMQGFEDLTIVNVAKALRAIGVKVSADAVKAAKASGKA